MTIPTYTETELRQALGAVGIGPGSVMALHSSLMHLGRLNGVPPRASPAHVLDAILEVIGPTGTVAVPASNWDYGAKGVPFDLQASPAAQDLGVLSNHVLSLPGVRRSPNPTFSLAILGPQAEWLCSGGNAHAFGFDSAWDRLFQLNAEMVFLGCDLQFLSFTRYMEMRFGVPYLYNKMFSVPVLDHGLPIAQPIVSLLRYRNIPVEYDLAPFQKVLHENGALREAPVGAATVKAVRMDACFALGMECLKQDIHFFLKKTPDYIPGQVPIQ